MLQLFLLKFPPQTEYGQSLGDLRFLPTPHILNVNISSSAMTKKINLVQCSILNTLQQLDDLNDLQLPEMFRTTYCTVFFPFKNQNLSDFFASLIYL